MTRKYKILLTITSLTFVLDQVVKYWIRSAIPLRGRPIVILPGLFQLVHAENTAAAWGILRNFEHRMPLLIVATVAAFAFIVYYYIKIPQDQPVVAYAMSFILGGAAGNFVDRVRFQSVTDYLDFYVGYDPLKGWLRALFRSNHWPSFNIADIAIVVGLILVMYDMVILEKRRARQDEGKGGSVTGVAEGGEAAP